MTTDAIEIMRPARSVGGRGVRVWVGVMQAPVCGDLLLHHASLHGPDEHGKKAARHHDIRGARSVAASYKPPMLVTRVRLPACAFEVKIPSLVVSLNVLKVRAFGQGGQIASGSEKHTMCLE